MTWPLHSPLRVRLHEGSVLPKMHARQVPRRRGPSGVAAAHDVQHAGATSMPTGKDLCPARVEVGLRLNQRPDAIPTFLRASRIALDCSGNPTLWTSDGLTGSNHSGRRNED